METQLTVSWAWYHRIAGNFQGRKLLRIGEKYDFHGENFRGSLACATPMNATPQISWRKLLWIASKPQNLQKFSPSKVSHYTVRIVVCNGIMFDFNLVPRSPSQLWWKTGYEASSRTYETTVVSDGYLLTPLVLPPLLGMGSASLADSFACNDMIT